MLEFTTEDKNFVEEEFGKWVMAASEAEEKTKKASKALKEEPAAPPVDEVEAEIRQIKEFIKPANPIKTALKEQPVEVESKGEFDDVLSQKVSETKKSFKFEKIGKKPPINEIDIFMDCVYILCKKEEYERFTFKQINSLVQEKFHFEFDYEIIQKAIELNYIKIVPDYTGISDTIEYELDAKGEKYLKNVYK